MRTPKLVIFDCDGVMVDSREADRCFYNDILSAFGCPPMTREQTDYVFMHDARTGLRFLFRDHPEVSAAEVEMVAAESDFTPYLRRMTLVPGLVDFLHALRRHGFTAISTNRAGSMQELLAAFELSHLFDFVMTAAVAPRPKPAPDGMALILGHFGLQPEEALYLGDTLVDAQYAAASGVPFVAFGNPVLEARYHAGTFAEVRALPPVQALLAGAPRPRP